MRSQCTAQTKSILFIGNSCTNFNGGIDKKLEGLHPDSNNMRIAPGGYTLEKHWNEGRALETIRSRKWDYVVLQEQIQTPVLHGSKFNAYEEKFDVEGNRNGARTIRLMT